MKRTVLTVVVLSANPLWALTFMGPPTSDLQQGQTRIGLDYSSSEYDADISGPLLSGTLAEVGQDAFFARLAAAPLEKTEWSILLGISEISDLGDEFAWGLGFKGTLIDSAPVSWGALFQMIHSEGDDSDSIGGLAITGDFDFYEMQIAVGPSYRAGNVCVYGGPFLHFMSGDVDIRFAGQTLSYDLEQESIFGGYVGLSAEIAQDVNFGLEGQFTADAVGLGAGVSLKF